MRSLRAKILALTALLVVLTQAGTIGTVLTTANREVQDKARADLVRASAMLDRFLNLRVEQLQNSMRILAADSKFVATITSGDHASVVQALKMNGARVEADIAVLLDNQGGVLAGAAGEAPIPEALPAVVRQAAEKGATRTTVSVGESVYELATVPLVLGPGQPREWLSMGIALDDARARRIAQLTGLEIAFVAEANGSTRLLGNSLVGIDPNAAAAASLRSSAGRDAIFSLSVHGDDYLTVRRPLLAGSSTVTVLLLRSVENALAPYRMLRLSAIALGILALVAALAGAAVVARAITRPVRQLAHAAIRIRNGDYSEPVEVAADDELGMLAAAFNTMQNGIAERENRITYQAEFDGLTGLPNRLLALTRLGQALTGARAASTPVSLLLVDLGSFGNVASALGHEIGDALLTQAAERLRASVDARHTVARLEGDEFLIILDGLGLDPARELAEDLLRLLGGGYRCAM